MYSLGLQLIEETGTGTLWVDHYVAEQDEDEETDDDGYEQFDLTWDYRGEDVVLYLNGTEIGTVSQYGFRVIMTLNGNDPVNFDEFIYGDG